MPELPEVETVVRVLRPVLLKRKIVQAKFSIPRQLRPQKPATVARSLKGFAITGVARRGKYILIKSQEQGILLIHLGMTGRLYVQSAGTSLKDHERAWFLLDNQRQLVFHDPRTLGVIRFFAAGEAVTPILKLGWEPLERAVTGAELRARLQSRTQAIKPLLLNQSIWAGIGNIYASEALWEAGIHPETAALRLSGRECERLSQAVSVILGRALENGGSSIRDFMSPDGEAGEYQKQFRVYDRAGEPCLRCGHEIRRIVQAARSTYFCPKCQKRKH